MSNFQLLINVIGYEAHKDTAMHGSFDDIIERCGKPDWYDQCGFPRYGTFTPNDISNIYATHAALLEILCQQCRQSFLVAIHCQHDEVEYKRMLWAVAYEAQNGKKPDLSPRSGFCIDPEGHQRIKLPEVGDAGWFVYGDPPIHGKYEWHQNCLAGDTMTSIPKRVIEFWIKTEGEWARHDEHEVDVWPTWADEKVPDTEFSVIKKVLDCD